VPVYPVCSRAAPHPVGRNRNTGDRTVRAPAKQNFLGFWYSDPRMPDRADMTTLDVSGPRQRDRLL